MRLSFTCTNLMPVVSWILQWGPHAKVIDPPELKGMVIDELERARDQYEIEERAEEARSRAPGVGWEAIKRDLLG